MRRRKDQQFRKKQKPLLFRVSKRGEAASVLVAIVGIIMRSLTQLWLLSVHTGRKVRAQTEAALLCLILAGGRTAIE